MFIRWLQKCGIINETIFHFLQFADRKFLQTFFGFQHAEILLQPSRCQLQIME
jgi:hypothetical protein